LEFREGMHGRRVTLRGLLSGSLIVFGGCTTPGAVEDSDALHRALGEALPERRVEPRTSLGERWSECRPPDRTDLIPDVSCAPVPPIGSAERNRLIRTVAQIRTAAAQDENARALHLLGLAQLLAGDESAGPETDEAVAILERAHVLAEDDAAILSDLAAARLVAAQRNDRPLDLVAALEAADSALERDPSFGPALFNRALALTSLRLQGEARAAWSRCLEQDGSEWEWEAKGWLDRLAQPTAVERWVEAETELERALIAGDAGRDLSQLVARHPQQVRSYVEDRALGLWADAVLSDDHSLPSRRLVILEKITTRLAEIQGDALLAGSISVIREADAPGRRRLAEAHRFYVQGRALHERQRYEDAAPFFAAAGDRFESGGSPFGFWSRFYGAVIVHHAPDFVTARTLFRDLSADRRYAYPIAQGYVDWMLGLSELRLANLGQARARFVTASESFGRAREAENVAAMSVQLAWTDAVLGDAESAWRHRYKALLGLSETVKSRRIVNVHRILATALDEIRSPMSVHFHSEHVEAARRSGNILSLALALAGRARTFGSGGRLAEARLDLAAAKESMKAIRDAGVRADLGVELRLVDAELLLAAGSTRAALATLDRTEEFARRLDEGRMLIETYRLRAVAYQASGERAEAERALMAGLAEVERQRSRLTKIEERRGYLDQSRKLTERLVALLFDTGRSDEAIEILERSRAPVLRETLMADNWLTHRSAAEIKRKVAPETVIVAYLVLSERTLVWVIRTNEIASFSLPIARLTLERAVQRLDDRLAGDSASLPEDATQRLLSTLLPVGRPGSARRLVFVPDGPLHDLPFAWLYDKARSDGVERMISIIPGVNAYLDLVGRSATSKVTTPSLLIVTDVPPSDRFPSLARLSPWDRGPVRELRTTLLDGREATPRALLDALPRHDVLLYRGHAVAVPGRPKARGLVLWPGDGDDGLLLPEEIKLPKGSRTRIAFLGGCTTAAGEVSFSEGAMGLAWSFLAAGVSTVILSRRPITESEADLVLERLLSAVVTDDTVRTESANGSRGLLSSPDLVVVGLPIDESWWRA